MALEVQSDKVRQYQNAAWVGAGPALQAVLGCGYVSGQVVTPGLVDHRTTGYLCRERRTLVLRKRQGCQSTQDHNREQRAARRTDGCRIPTHLFSPLHRVEKFHPDWRR